MSFTNFLEAKLADHVFGAQTYTPPTTLYVALHSAYPNEAGLGGELSGFGYARAPITNNLSNWPSYVADQKQNGSPVNFGPASGSWIAAVAFAIWDAPTAGNLLARGWLGSDQGKVFTAKAAGDLLTAPGHSLVVDDQVAVIAIPSAVLPTGLLEGTIYFVKTVSGDDITLAATLGGAVIDLTAVGAGLIKKVTPKAVPNGDTLTFNAGTITILLD